MGITHILFAPRNSDVSSQGNNTDPWGWEQLLWFGYGQKIRMGEWKPGDPLAASTQEMLDYFKEKNVKPVAYVYPILAFLAVKNATFCAIYSFIKFNRCIILPRQARDDHRESTQKGVAFP